MQKKKTSNLPEKPCKLLARTGWHELGGLCLTLTHMWTFCSLGFSWGLFYEDGERVCLGNGCKQLFPEAHRDLLAGQSRSEQTSAPSLLPYTPLLPLGAFPSPLLPAHFLLSLPSFPFSSHPSILLQGWLRCSDHIFSVPEVWCCRVLLRCWWGCLGEVTVGGTGPCYLILALLSPLLAFLQS